MNQVGTISNELIFSETVERWRRQISFSILWEENERIKRKVFRIVRYCFWHNSREREIFFLRPTMAAQSAVCFCFVKKKKKARLWSFAACQRTNSFMGKFVGGEKVHSAMHPMKERKKKVFVYLLVARSVTN